MKKEVDINKLISDLKEAKKEIMESHKNSVGIRCDEIADNMVYAIFDGIDFSKAEKMRLFDEVIRLE